MEDTVAYQYDFEAIKTEHSIESVAERLGLDLKKSGGSLRGKCPVCESTGDRNLAITPAKRAYYCFADQKGGDCIQLVAHVQGIGVKEAAAWIAGEQTGNTSGTEPKERGGFKPLDYLESDHPAVEAVGFTAEDAARLGAGYAPRGIMRGTVAVPVRDPTGKLLGYIGVTEAILPKTWAF